MIRSLFAILSFSVLACVSAAGATPAEASPSKPALRALLITGGCCHDYPAQTKFLQAALANITPVEWTVLNEGGTGTRAELPFYNDPHWADPYDIVIHNACFADTDNPDYIRKITAAHRTGKPAMVIHCAMHTYRAAQSDDWREFLGVTSHRHDHQSRYPVRPVAPAHAALKGFPEVWLTPPDELYIIEKLWPGAQALAVSTSEKDGHDYPVIWTNHYHGARVFGTTFGHNNATWEDPVFQALLAHGFLWAAGREN